MTIDQQQRIKEIVRKIPSLTAGQIYWLERVLQESGISRVHPLHADFLTVDLPSLLKEKGLGQVRAVGNLPFSVASPILLRLLSFRKHLVDLTLTFQLEVAERLVAPPGTKRTRLSLEERLISNRRWTPAAKLVIARELLERPKSIRVRPMRSGSGPGGF